MRLSLRQLQAFSAVARLASFVTAAQSMHLTAAALSHLVKDLEGELGFRVFARTTRRVELTEQGRAFLTHAEHLLDALGSTESMAHEIAHQRSGHVRLAMTSLMHITLLPTFYPLLQQRLPELSIDLIELPSDSLVQSVETSQSDLAVSFARPSSDALDAQPLFVSRLHAVVPHGHKLERRKTLRWSDLQGERLIFVAKNMELRVRAELGPDTELTTHHRTTNSITAFGLVASGMGIAIVPGYAQPLAKIHRLTLVPLRAPIIDRQFTLYRRRDAESSPACVACHQFLADFFSAKLSSKTD